MKNIRPLILLLLAAASAKYLFAQAKTFDFAELEKTALAELAETKTPGASVAIVWGGKIIFIKGFRSASAEGEDRITEKMLFRIVLTTKIFTPEGFPKP